MTQQPQFQSKSEAQAWFESLSFKNQEVIRWFSDTFGRGLSRQRGWIVSDFWRAHCQDKPPVQVPTADKYEYCYDHFEEFKEYAFSRAERVPSLVEGGAR